MKISSHLLTSVLGAVLGWSCAYFYLASARSAPDAADPSEQISGLDDSTNRGPFVAERLSARESPPGEGADARGGELRRISVNAKGNFVVPKRLIARLSLFLVTPDFTIEPEEADLIGLSQREVSDLESLLADVRDQNRNLEATGFKVLEQKDSILTLEIPGDAVRAEGFENRINDRLAQITGDKNAIVSSAMGTAIEGLTASYGRNTRILRVESEAGDSYVFKTMDFNPQSLETLRATEASDADYERASSRTAVYWSKEVPTGLKHLLE